MGTPIEEDELPRCVRACPRDVPVIPMPRRQRRRRLPLVTVGVLGALVLGACSYTADLPELAPDAETSRIYAADGTLLTELSVENRDPVPLDRIAPVMQQAIVAIEDSRFFEHNGVDPRGIARAAQRNYEDGGVSEGGSTITQQYVRAVLLNDTTQSLDRKLREAVLAWQFEQTYTKEQILEKYLNAIYFGAGAYGIESAAKTYFHRSAADLTLDQAAFIAGLAQGPERLSPYTNYEGAVSRRNAVLDAMVEQGMITHAEGEAAKAAPLLVEPPPSAQRYPAGHFVERVKDFILNSSFFGDTPEARRRLLLEGGLQINTTLDLQMQSWAEAAVMNVAGDPNGPRAALVSLEPDTGAVRAYVGGYDFFGDTPEAKFDLAGQGLRQSGSSFKAFVLGAALEHGIPLTQQYPAPGSMTIDTSVGPWNVRNYDGSGRGSMDLVAATASSVNTVYAQLIMDIGPEKVIDFAQRAGIRTSMQAYPSSALGTNGVTVLDMASAYATFAADGMHAEPLIVTSVTQRDGTVIYEAPAARRRVVDANVARLTTATLTQVVTRGTGTRAAIGRPVAGKTGTAEEWRDAWFVGFTPQLSTAVWMGFPGEERSMIPPNTSITVSGGTLPTQIWHDFMIAATASMPVEDFIAPEFPPPPPPTTLSAEVTVPNVVGLSINDARRAIDAAGFTIYTTAAPSRTVAGGLVAEQSPGALRSAPRGSVVRLVVSSGPPAAVAVPDVLGLYSDEAVGRLTRQDLVAEIVVEPEPAEPGDVPRPGRVWSQTPGQGQLLDQGSVVTLRVNPT